MFYKFLLPIVIILGLPITTRAYPGQYSWDPLYVEIHETPLQIQQRQDSLKRSENQNKINNLIAQYGATIYSKCYQSYCAKGDMGNPNTQAMCLASLEYNCLKRESAYSKLREEANTTQQMPSVSCPKIKFPLPDDLKFIYYKGSCLNKDEACFANYGINSKFGYGPDSMPLDKEFKNVEAIVANCVCKTGYEWKNNQCAIKKITIENNPNNKPVTGSQVQGKVIGESNKKDIQPVPKEKILSSTVASLNVRQTPSLKAKVVWGIKKGVSYAVIGEQTDWYQIKISNKLSGWVMKKYAKIKI